MSSRLIPLFFLLISSVSNGQIEDLSFGTPETFDIMTWNIEQFPKNGQTTVNYVSDIIQNLEMDIIAIQEVDNINYFEQMVAGLNLYEGYLESEWFAGLAYIYNSEVIQINDSIRNIHYLSILECFSKISNGNGFKLLRS